MSARQEAGISHATSPTCRSCGEGSRGALAMPDVHLGYGFPVGGVAAAAGAAVHGRGAGDGRETLVHELSRSIPAGRGRHGALELDDRHLDRVLVEGPAALVRDYGIGNEQNPDRTESRGVLADACGSAGARERFLMPRLLRDQLVPLRELVGSGTQTEEKVHGTRARD